MATSDPSSETSACRQVVKNNVAEVSYVLDEMVAVSVFLVADPNAYHGSGAALELHECLSNRNVTQFTQFDPNPKLERVLEGIELFKADPPDVVLAVGGGTAIDIAKLINFLAAQSTEPAKALTIKGDAQPGRPLIAVPTTAGSGSEATRFAVVYVDGVKHSMDHLHIRPSIAVVDPALTTSMPNDVAVHSGLDALCQSIESLWSVHADEVSIPIAAEALELLLPNLPHVGEAASLDVCAAMSKGAYMAGKAIDITRTTAAHALSYPLTSRFGVPHGAAVALMIGPVLLYNSGVSPTDCSDPDGSEAVQKRIGTIVRMLGCKTAEEGESWLTGLIAAVGAPTRLSDVGIQSAEQVKSLVAEVNAERLTNNPRKLGPEAITKLYANLI